jgi:hypothetical protein
MYRAIFKSITKNMIQNKYCYPANSDCVAEPLTSLLAWDVPPPAPITGWRGGGRFRTSQRREDYWKLLFSLKNTFSCFKVLTGIRTWDLIVFSLVFFHCATEALQILTNLSKTLNIYGPHSFAKYFFPPNFSLVFWKRKIWREKIYSSKEWILLCKGVFSNIYFILRFGLFFVE